VLLFSKMPHNVCVCQLHENLRCALKCMRKADIIMGSLNTDYSMHLNFVCDNPTFECFHNACIDCKDGKKFEAMFESIEDKENIITWTKWVKVNKKTEKTPDQVNQYCNVEKVSKTGSIRELAEELIDASQEFLEHEYVKITQEKTARKLIENAMKSDSNEAVICCDFAEKFKIIQQNAPQSAHYGQSQVSLFTVAIYYRQKLTSMTIASDCEKSSKECVLSYADLTICSLDDSVEVVHFWTDNATSQFKNQYVMQAIKTFESKYKIKIIWHFYAPMHGKSVVDGIGGTVKRYVRNRIIAENRQDHQGIIERHEYQEESLF